MICLSCGQPAQAVRVCWCYADLCDACAEDHMTKCHWFQKQTTPGTNRLNKSEVKSDRRSHRRHRR